uniref:tRNA-specific adenosine deaminase 1 n=1 Tax=Tetraodon nigroviridis TaxID=99883 RepID=H3CTW5_TETNG
ARIEIARLCYERFDQLPRRGKPEAGREWTLLAAVLRTARSAKSDQGLIVSFLTVTKEVVSLATGTKCVGRSAVSPSGDVLNDSHAEVIARRGCVRYLIQELHRAVTGGDSAVFCRAEQRGKWKLKPGVSFHFFSSHTPCGDASIVPMTDSQSQPCPPVTSVKDKAKGSALKRKDGGSGGGETTKTTPSGAAGRSRKHAGGRRRSPTIRPSNLIQKLTLEGRGRPGGPGRPAGVRDIHRTGAKCVPGAPPDPLQAGEGYHNAGVLRVKPGRGEPTLSLSCSDKLARWGVLGFQGALSHYLQEALYFTSVVVGACPFSQEVMDRALVTRCSQVSKLPDGFSVRPPSIIQASVEFPFSQGQTELRHRAGQGRISPCGAAISWCNVAERPLDVTANGYKQGVTKKTLGTEKARSLLCKLELFHSFLSLVSATEPSARPSSLRAPGLQTYWDYKQASQSYQQAWQQLRSQAFPLWPRGDRSLLQFR